MSHTIVAMPSDLEAAWDDLHDATPPGWYVGRPVYIEGRRTWEQYAFDRAERAQVGAGTVLGVSSRGS